MAKSSKQSYETKWQKAFEDAEVQPSAQLWKNIESDLNATENAKFKRGLLFYRTLAAAAVVCLLILGIYTWSDEFAQWMGSEQEIAVSDQQNTDASNNPSETDELIEDTQGPERVEEPSAPADARASLVEAEEKNTGKETEEGPVNSNTTDNQTNKLNPQTLTGPVADNRTVSSGKSFEKNESAGQVVGDTHSENALSLKPEKRPLLAMLSTQGIDGNIMENINLNKPIGEIYPIPVMPKDRKKDFQPVFFAGLNLSTDYFNPNYEAQQAGEALAAPNTFFADQAQEAVYNLSGNNGGRLATGDGNLGENNTARLSFSYGVNFGMALSEHWVIESGLTYSKYNTSTQTYATFQGIAADEAYPVSIANNSVENVRQFSSVRYEQTQTQLTNTFDFVAVPMKVGYNLSFDRINVVFSTGVAANFLLQNNISDDAGQLNEVTIKPDESSPFRKVYYSGILSGGIHYRIMERYSFSITPSYNFPISSLTKSESNFMSLPYLFGIDFGIRYQF